MGVPSLGGGLRWLGASQLGLWYVHPHNTKKPASWMQAPASIDVPLLSCLTKKYAIAKTWHPPLRRMLDLKRSCGRALEPEGTCMDICDKCDNNAMLAVNIKVNRQTMRNRLVACIASKCFLASAASACHFCIKGRRSSEWATGQAPGCRL